VLLATVRALKYHGGVPLERLGEPDGEAVVAGFANLEKHSENVQAFGLPCVVALNRFADDGPVELAAVRRLCEGKGVACAVASVWELGGKGGLELIVGVV
jgi:formate--tetrahydrofolate ligase